VVSLSLGKHQGQLCLNTVSDASIVLLAIFISVFDDTNSYVLIDLSVFLHLDHIDVRSQHLLLQVKWQLLLGEMSIQNIWFFSLHDVACHGILIENYL